MQILFNKHLSITITALVILGFSVFGQQTPKEQPTVRPSVGLVLSGGGAKGFAYIGMLRVLDEVNMPIDYIGGSSIGAIVGALYAVGYHPDTIESIIRSQDWDQVIANTLDRKYFSYEEKLYGGKFIIDIPINNKKIAMDNSLSGSLHIDIMLNRFFSPAFGVSDFNQLNIPFLCIGTDVITGEAVVMDKGNLARAIRASMAIPGYFPMVEYDGYYMIDGGVVNNYPARQVKDMGADIIIGGDVQHKIITNVDELKSVPKLLDHIIGYNRLEANEEGFALTDLYVHIDMEYSMMDFVKYDSIIALGERVARTHYDEIKALADSLNAIEPSPLRLRNTSPLSNIFIDSVKVNGPGSVVQKVHEGYFDNTGKTDVTISGIEDAMQFMEGSKSFKSIFYEIEKQNDKTNLIINVEKGDEGSISAGIHYDNIYQGSILANLSIRNIFNTRTKFFTDLILGQNPRLKSLLILNNGLKPGLGVEIDFYSFNLSQYKEGEKVNQLKFENFGGQVFLPITFKNDFMFKTGLQYDYFKYKQDVKIDSTLPRVDDFYSYGGAFVQFNYDSRDKMSFATSGSKTEFKVKYHFPIETLFKTLKENSLILYLKYDLNVSLHKRLVFKPGAFLGYTFSGDLLMVQHLFGVGGLNPSNYVENHVSFTGVRFIEDFSRHVGIARANFQYNVFDKIYLTAMSDFGFSERNSSNIAWDSMVAGYGGKLSYDSFIGPVEFAVMGSTVVKGPSYFLNIGFWF